MSEDSLVLQKFKSYNGNQLLKREGVQINWTPDLIEEYVRCAEDPIYFVEKYMKIINVDKGLISFKLFDYQKKMLRSMVDNRYTIIATARQVGKSTTTCAAILWYIIFNSEKTVALLANKGGTAREILGKIQLAYQHLPKWLQQGVGKWNEGSFELENNSRVIATSTTADNIRGYSVNLVFIDEAAFIDNWNEFFTSVFPTISSGQTTKVVLVSTPNGLNHFYKLWTDANEGRNNYYPIKVSWEDVPGRDETWMRETLAAMGNDDLKFAQEYSVDFQGSSSTLIAGWKLKHLLHKNPVAKNETMGLRQYFLPERGRSYVLTADVSRGKGLDHHAFHVIDITEMPYRQVCVFRNNTTPPIEYAEIVNQTARFYNRAAVLVEINDNGQQIADILHYDYEYDNIIYTEHAGRGGKRVSGGFGQQVERGIRTTKSVKLLGCSILKLLIEQDQLILNDFDTIQEFSTFSRKGKSFEAESGATDDLVMGLVIFSWLTDQQYFKELTDINTVSKLREKTDEELMEELMPFGFIDNGDDEEEQLVIDSPPVRHWINGDF